MLRGRSMSRRIILLCIAALAAGALMLPAQTTLFNNGAVIGIGSGAQIGVIGTMVTQNSDIDIVTSASLRVEGDLTVSSNTLTALGSAELIVTGNLVILAPGTVIRMTNGTINVSRNILNNGTLDNRGTVNVGKP